MEMDDVFSPCAVCLELRSSVMDDLTQSDRKTTREKYEVNFKKKKYIYI